MSREKPLLVFKGCKSSPTVEILPFESHGSSLSLGGGHILSGLHAPDPQLNRVDGHAPTPL